MKTCPKCKITKTTVEFWASNHTAKNSGTKIAEWCISCRTAKRLYEQSYYHSNLKRKKAVVTRATEVRKSKKQNKKALLAELKSVPCKDCGKTYPPYVMDFDHVRGAKSFNISYSEILETNKILEEAKKCDVVCSNCHRIRTFKRSVPDTGVEPVSSD